METGRVALRHPDPADTNQEPRGQRRAGASARAAPSQPVRLRSRDDARPRGLRAHGAERDDCREHSEQEGQDPAGSTRSTGGCFAGATREQGRARPGCEVARVTSNADGRGRIQPRQRGQLCHRAAPEKANWPASVSSQPKTGGPLSRCAEGTVVTGRLRPKPADDLLFYSPRAKNGFYVFHRS